MYPIRFTLKCISECKLSILLSDETRNKKRWKEDKKINYKYVKGKDIAFWLLELQR